MDAGRHSATAVVRGPVPEKRVSGISRRTNSRATWKNSPVGNAKGASRGGVFPALVSRELVHDLVDRGLEGLVEERHVGTMPRWEDGVGVGAVADTLVGIALNPIPRDVGHTVDTGDLVVGEELVLRHALEVAYGEQEQVPRGGVGRQLADLATCGHSAGGAADGKGAGLTLLELLLWVLLGTNHGGCEGQSRHGRLEEGKASHCFWFFRNYCGCGVPFWLMIKGLNWVLDSLRDEER